MSGFFARTYKNDVFGDLAIILDDQKNLVSSLKKVAHRLGIELVRGSKRYGL
jgi:hypothetical protein